MKPEIGVGNVKPVVCADIEKAADGKGGVSHRVRQLQSEVYIHEFILREVQQPLT